MPLHVLPAHHRQRGRGVNSPQLRSQLAGTFDDPSWIDISRHIWTRSAQHWVPIPEGPPRFEKQGV